MLKNSLNSAPVKLNALNPLSAKKYKVKSKVKVTLCQRAPRLPASPSLITSQFQSLVAQRVKVVIIFCWLTYQEKLVSIFHLTNS